LGIDLTGGQSHKDMNRNHLGDELGATNNWFDNELANDEGSLNFKFRFLIAVFEGCKKEYKASISS
jgi:hypothetical protein